MNNACCKCVMGLLSAKLDKRVAKDLGNELEWGLARWKIRAAYGNKYVEDATTKLAMKGTLECLN